MSIVELQPERHEQREADGGPEADAVKQRRCSAARRWRQHPGSLTNVGAQRCPSAIVLCNGRHGATAW